MNAAQYKQYLLSSAWKERAQICLERYDHKCAVCGCDWRRREIHVHHLTYKNVGNEQQEDLVALCKTHHDEIHKLPFGYDRDGLDYMIANFTDQERIKDQLLCSGCYEPIDPKKELSCSLCGSRPILPEPVINLSGMQSVSSIMKQMIGSNDISASKKEKNNKNTFAEAVQSGTLLPEPKTT